MRMGTMPSTPLSATQASSLTTHPPAAKETYVTNLSILLTPVISTAVTLTTVVSRTLWEGCIGPLGCMWMMMMMN
jgi:hypothetical protein